MSEINSPSNKLLATVPAASLAKIFPKFELVPLVFGEHLHLAGAPINNLYFPESGLVSLVSSTEDSSYIEVGMIGSEGVEGFAVALGADRSTGTTFIQGAGAAYKVSASDFSEMNEAFPTFRRATLR